MRAALGSIVMMMTASVADAQTVAEQLQAEQLEQARLATAKAAGSVLEPLKATSGGITEFTNPERTAEAAIIQLALYDRLTRELARRAGAASPVFVVTGAAPPTTTHWIQFNARRAALLTQMKAANDAWSAATGKGEWNAIRTDRCRPAAAAKGDANAGHKMEALGISPTGPAAAVALLGSVLNLTESTVKYTGSTLTLGNSVPATLLYARLSGAKPQDAALAIDDAGPQSQRRLMEPLTSALATLRTNTAHLTDCLSRAGGDQAKIGLDLATAGTALRAAGTAYAALDDSLLQDIDGQSAATVIVREQLYASPAAARTIISILDHQVAMTVITRRNVFAGLADRSTMGAYGTITYAIARTRQDATPSADGPTPIDVARGIIACTVPATKLKRVTPATLVISDCTDVLADPALRRQ